MVDLEGFRPKPPLGFYVLSWVVKFKYSNRAVRRSTEQILSVAVDTITQALDDHKIVCTAFFDLRKAFDSLDHIILLERLSKLGVHGTALSWFKNYLSNCIYTTCYEMPSLVEHSKLLQFTDDTTVICLGENRDVVRKELNSDLQRIAMWIMHSKMKFNIQKI